MSQEITGRKSFKWLLVSLAALAATVLCTQIIGVFWYARTHHGHIGTWERDSPLANLDTSILAVLASIVAGYSYRVASRTDNRSQNHRVLDLFLKFDDEHYRAVRRIAWEARSKWYRLDDNRREAWRKRLISLAVPSEIDNAIPPVPPAGQTENTSDHQHTDEFSSVFQMLNLYEALAFFECDSAQLRRVGLYYPWWRGFLLEVVNAYEKAYEKLTPQQQAMFPKEQWREAFLLLDDRFNLPAYKEEDDPLVHPSMSGEPRTIQ